MIYMKWTTDELATLKSSVLYTEVDDDGWVQRELTLAGDGTIAEQLVPTSHQPGWFGLTRLCRVMLEDNVSKAEFETLWHSGANSVSD
jgi:hypothetical protein